jgi:hypothetical protein
MQRRMRRTCLEGQGTSPASIAELLGWIRRFSVMAVADPRFGAAKVLARLLPSARLVGLAAAGGFDAAPVLVPPDTHAAIALPLLEQAPPFVPSDDVAAAIIGALQAEQAVGRCCNLISDVRPTARECLAWLAEATDGPLRFHPKLPASLLGEKGGEMAAESGRQTAFTGVLAVRPALA